MRTLSTSSIIAKLGAIGCNRISENLNARSIMNTNLSVWVKDCFGLRGKLILTKKLLRNMLEKDGN